MSQHTVKISVELEMLKNSVDDIQKVLNTLKPDTKAFTALQNIVKNMTKDLGAAQTNIAKGFSSNADFKATEKIIERISAALSKTGDITKRITFSDLKLDKATTDQYSKLVDDLKKARHQYENFQKTMVKDTLAQGSNKQILQAINPDLVNKSFDEIVKGISDGVKAAESELQQLQEAYAKLQEQMTKTQNVQSKVDSGSGDTLSGLLDPAAFKKFFSTKQNGDVIFKSIKGGGIQEQFLQYMQQQFNIPDNKIEQLRNKTAKQIQNILGSINFWEEVNQGQQVQKIDLSNMMGDIQANVTDFTQLGQVFATTGQQATVLHSNVTTAQAAINKFAAGALNANGALQSMPASMSAAASQLQGFKNQLEQATVTMLKYQQIQNTFNSIKSTVMNFMGFTQILNLVKRGVKDAAKNIKELDTVMNGISIVTKMSTSDLWNQVDAYTKMAQQYGVTTKGAYEVSKIYYQQGLQQRDVMTLTEQTLKLSKISGLDYATTTDYMTTALRGFKMQMTDASRVVDVYSALAANTAVSQQQLAEAMTRTASSMESVGSTFEEASAMISTMVAVTRQSASNIGSALKSIASRYGEMKKAPEELMDSEGEALSFNKVDTALQSVGINMKTTENQFRSFTDVIIELSDKWQTLESTQQRYIATQFAGNRQQSRFLALVSNGELLKNNLRVAEESEGTGTTQALKALDSLESKINQVQNAYQQFYLGIGVEDVWKGFLDGAKNVLNTLNSFPKLFNKFPVVALTAIANLIRLAKTGLLTGLQSLAALIVPTIRTAWESEKIDAAEQGKSTGEIFANAAKNSLKQQFSKRGTMASMIGSLISSASLMIDQQTRSGQILGGSLNAIGGLTQGAAGAFQLATGNIPMGIMNLFSGFTSIIAGISTAVQTTEEKITRLNNEAKTLSDRAAQLKGEEKSLYNLKNEYDTLKEKQYESQQAAQNFQDTQNKIADEFPNLVQSIDAVGNATINAAAMQQQLSQARIASAQATLQAANKQLEAKKIEAQNKRAEARLNIQSSAKSFARNNAQYDNINVRSLIQATGVTKTSGLVQGLDYDQSVIYKILRDEQLLSSSILDIAVGNTEAYDNFAEFLDEGIKQVANKNLDFNELLSNILNYWEQVDSNAGTDFTSSTLHDLISSYLSGNANPLVKIQKIFDEVVEKYLGDPNDQNFTDLRAAYNEYASAVEQLKYNNPEQDFSAIEEELTFYAEQLRAVGTGNKTLEAAKTSKLRAELKTKQQKIDKQVQNSTDNILNNNIMMSLISGELLLEAEKKSPDNFDQFWESKQAEIDALNNEWKALSKTTREQLTKNLQDTRHLSNVNQIIEGLDDINLEGSLVNWLQQYVDKITTDVKTNIANYAQSQATKTDRTVLKDLIPNLISDAIDTEIESSIVRNVISLLEQIAPYSTNATLVDVSNAGQQLISSVAQLPQEITDIINNNGLSLDGIKKSLAAIGDFDKTKLTEEQQDAVSLAESALEFLRARISSSLSLSIQATQDELVKSFGDQKKSMSKMSSGMDVDEAISILNSLNSWIKDDALKFDNSDIIVDASGKLVFSADSYTRAMNVFSNHIMEEATALETSLNQATALLEQSQQSEDLNLILENLSVVSSVLSPQQFNKFFITHKDSEGNIKDITFSEEFDVKEFYNAMDTALMNLQGDIDNYQDLVNLAIDAMSQQSNWKKGNYTGLSGSIASLAKKDQKELNDNEQKAVEQFRSGMLSMLNDAIQYGTDYVATKSYDYVPKSYQDRLVNTYKDKIGNYITNFSDILGLTIDQTNDLVLKANESVADLSKKSTVKDVVSSLQFFDDTTAYITEEKAAQLASAANLLTKNILDKTDSKTIEGTTYYKLLTDPLTQLDANFTSVDNWILQKAISVQEKIDQLKGFLQNKNLTEAQQKNVSELVNNLGLVLQQGVSLFEQDNVTGQWSISNQAKQAILDASKDNNEKISQVVLRSIKDSSQQTAQDAINALQNVGKLQTSGTSNLAEMQGIIDTIKKYNKQFTGTLTNGAFEYSTALHGFVMSANTVQQYINALTDALTKATDAASEQQIMDQLRSVYLQMGDIENFVDTFKQVGRKKYGVGVNGWISAKSNIISRLQKGDLTALQDLPGALTYMDQMEQVLINRADGISNLIKLLTENGELTTQDIERNRNAFIGTEYQKSDAGIIKNRFKTLDDFKQFATTYGQNALKAYYTGVLQSQQEQEEALLNILQDNAKVSQDQIKKLGSILGGPLLQDGELTQLGQNFLIKEGKHFITNGPAIREYIKENQNNNNYLIQEVQKVEADLREKQNSNIRTIFEYLIEANNESKVKQITNVGDELLDAAEKIVRENLSLTSLITVDRENRSIQFKDNYIGDIAIESAMKKYKQAFGNDFDNVLNGISNTAEQRFTLIKEMLNNATDISKEQISRAKDLELSSLLSTAGGRTTLNLGKVQQYITKEANAFQQYRVQTLNNMLSGYSSEEMLGEFFTKESFKKEDLDLALGNYNQLHGTQIAYEDDWLKIQNGKAKWTYKGLQKWINELQAQEFDISKQVIAEKNNELYEVLQKLLQSQALDQEDIDILQSHGVTASTGKGMQYDSRTKQVAKTYLKEISQIPSKLQEFASTMWDFGYVDQFVEAATQLSGYGQSDKEGLKNAIINRDLNALTTKYKTGLGAFYSTVFSSLNSDVESVFSLVLQQATLGNGQQGYIDVHNDPQLKMLMQNLGLDNILHEDTDIYGNLVGYFVDGIDTIRDAIISAIFNSGLQGKTKLSLRRQARNSIQQELSASDITPILTSAYDNISIELVDNLIEALGITDENEINDFINKYFIDEGDHLRQTQELRQALLSKFKYLYDPKELNEVEQTLNQMDRESSVEISFRDVALNYKNLSNELVKKLATNLNIDFNVLRDQLGYDFITNTYDPNKVKAYLDANKDKFKVDAEIQKMYDTEAEAIKDSFSNLFSGISSVLGQGTYQEIETSIENSQMLAFMASQLPDMMQGVVDQNGNIYKYILHATQQNITAAIDVLTLLRDNDEIRENNGLGNVTDAEINNFITSLKSSQAAISPQTLLTDLLKDYTNIAYDKLYLVSQTLGLDIEKIATEESPGQYKLNLDNVQEIIDSINNLWSQGFISDQTKNNLLSQIKSIQWQESPESAVLAIINSGEEISAELINSLIAKLPASAEIIQKYFTLGSDNNYRLIEGSTIQAFVQDLQNNVSLNFEQWMLDLLEQQATDILETINSLGSQVTSGTNSATEMKKVLDEINDSRKNAPQLNYSDIYQYSDITHSFVLTQTGIAEQLKRFNEDLLNKEDITSQDLQLLEKQRESFMHTLGEQIDLKAVLDATGELEKTQATQAFFKAIDNYNFAAGQTGYQEITNDLISNALNGSFDAISQIYSILGRTMTFDEQSSLLNASADKLIKATDVFTAAVGENIDQYAAQLLERAGGAAERQGTSDIWKVTQAVSPDQLANAYMQAYYEGLAQHLSQDKLSELLKKSWDAAGAQDTSIANALSNAASMTLSEFGSFLKEQGYTLTDQIMQQMQDEGIFSMIDANNLRLNLHQFAQKFNVNESSKEFIEAYSSLQDAVIEEQTRLRESIEEEINSILEAKPGDLLNISTLANIFKDSTIFEDFGITLSDGIATIVEESDLLGVASAIAQACSDAGMIIPEQLQAIQDAIQEVLEGFIDALSNGISGNLSGSGKRSVISQAKQFLQEDLSDNDFIRTADGFKLTTDAAIRMYSALKQIDSVQASKLFEGLSERTFGSTAGMQTMTGQMQRIADLQRQINTLRQKQSSAGEKDAQANIEATIGKLQQELELYQQIAQQRAGGDPSAYDFMGQGLPDYLQGPENYWNAWGNAFNAMHDAAENGGYAIQDFYNIVNQMNNIAALTGDEFQLFGQTLNGDLTGMTKLIEKGFQTIKNVDGKGAKVTLEGIGIDFESGAAGMSGNIEDGIHAMAQSQIDMLDGLIAFLETIVAMQKLGSVDTDFSGSIDMGEIFANGTDWANGFTKEFEDFRSQILNMAKDNKDLQNAIQNTQITLDNTTMSLQQLFTKGAQDFKDIDVETFTNAWNSFYKLVQSDDFNLQNPLAQENLDLIAQSGLNLQYKMPDGNTLVVQDGQWIMSSEPGKYQVDGKQFTDPQAALTYRNKKSAEDTMKSFADSHRGNERLELSTEGQTLTLKASGLAFDITPGQNKGFIVDGKQCDNWAAVEQAMIDKLNEGRQQAYTTREARIRLGLEVVPELHADASQLSSSQIAKLKADGINSWQSILNNYGNTKDSQLEFEVKYGFKPAQDVSADVQAAFNEQLNQPEVELKANITADGESVKISGPVHVDLVADNIDVAGASIINSNLSGNTANPDAMLNTGDTTGKNNTAAELVDTVNKSGADTISAVEQSGEQTATALQSLESTVDSVGSTVQNISEQQVKDAREDNLTKPSETSDTSGKESSSSAKDDKGAAQAQAIVQAATDTLNQAVESVNTAAGNVSGAVESFAGAMSSMSSAASEASSGVTRAAGAIRNTYNNLPSGSKPPVHVSVQVEVKATNGTVTNQSPLGPVQVAAKGNVALAHGQKTLMGELGPELVVSDGRYHLVGQNGAEMVDLAPDAIVFNHLQTKRLLANGHAGRGKPITNQRTAVAWAKGTGPAMASAEAVLAALKQIRAMWQAMLGASMKDLGALAGNEGGGGGGGGGGKKPPQLKAILDDIERWYNLVRQIAKIEQDITYQQTLQSKLQSDRIANGQAVYKSYKREIDLLDQQIIRNQELAMLQKSYYEAKRQEFTESDYGRFYTYDENGLLQLKDGIDKGMDVLFKLNEKNVYGETSGAATNAKTQIEYLRSIGFNTQNLKYNGDGTVIDASSDDYKDNPDKIYEDMMNNFWDNLDGWKEDLDSIYDEYHEQLNTVLENEDKRNQLLQTIVDNQLSVEQDVLKAIEARQQKLIDELQNERDALEKSTQNYIDGLNDQLKEERQMYENAENEKELVKLRRQVVILQRSGGSASQIHGLQEQIAAKEQDQYFSQQQQQIAAIQKASDLQIERMDSQIEIMTEALEYQKQQGLLWDEVYQIMASTPEQIRQFIMENTPDFQSASALDVAEKIRDIDLRINEWVSYRDDESAPDMNSGGYYDWNSYSQSRDRYYGERASDELKSQAKAEFDRVLQDTGDINLAGEAADAIFKAVLGEMPRMPDETSEDTSTPITTPTTDYKKNNYKDYDYGSDYNYNRNNNNTNKNTSTTDSKKTSWTFSASDVGQSNLMAEMDALKKDYIGASGPQKNNMVKTYQKNYNLLSVANKKKYSKHIYKQGGLVDYTGLAQVDGTPQRPEAFINAEQTQMLRDYLFGGSNSLLSLAQQIVHQMHGVTYSSSTLHQEESNGINIQNVDVNVNVKQIANDYDVRSIGNTVMDEMLKIARKSGTRGLSRR